LGLHRRPGFAGGRGSRPGVGRRPWAGAAAQAASSSRSWCRRRGGTARPWRPARRRWPDQRRAAPRSVPAAPRSAGPGPGRAKSPRRQVIEHRFETESAILLTGTGWSGQHRRSRAPAAWVDSRCSQSRFMACSIRAATSPGQPTDPDVVTSPCRSAASFARCSGCWRRLGSSPSRSARVCTDRLSGRRPGRAIRRLAAELVGVGGVSGHPQPSPSRGVGGVGCCARPGRPGNAGRAAGGRGGGGGRAERGG
jgi:hypothetical protein